MKNIAAKFILLLLAVPILATWSVHAADTVRLTELDLTNLHYAGWSKPQLNRAQEGKALAIAGKKYANGLATYATSSLWLELDGSTERFRALVGVDDAANDPDAIVVFSVYADDRKLWASDLLKRGAAPQEADINLKGVRSLLLKVDLLGDSYWKSSYVSDWLDARFTVAGARPRTVLMPHEVPIVLTPKPPAEPRINGPRVYGCRPGHPFLFRIPTTGDRPLKFSAQALPPGLWLDADSGVITGTVSRPGTYSMTLQAENQRGTATQPLKIVCGDTLALTPPMGWNHWYAHYERINDAIIRKAADQLVNTGMADVGYAYVNIDGGWTNTTATAKQPTDPRRMGPFRDLQGNIRPNENFPNMPALTAYIHAKGLKAGIYSSPGPLDCAGYAASYQHEEQDAKQFARWGFDFLKYDWCSYSEIAQGDNSLATLKKPYQLMGGILKSLPRDVVFNLCQYGEGHVSEWGAAVGAQSWRTAGDLGGELNRIFDIALKNAEYRQWSKPGAWNDPDFIQIGYIGDARIEGELKPCPLTPTEQYAFMSLWCLSAAPLIYSGDMSRLDEFTLNVLCNPEVIAVDQDPLGECARVVPLTPETFLMIKQLEDGSKSVGLCNRGEITAKIVLKWTDLGVSGRQRARDLWRQHDLGDFEGQFEATVPRHGVLLLRLAPSGK